MFYGNYKLFNIKVFAKFEPDKSNIGKMKIIFVEIKML